MTVQPPPTYEVLAGSDGKATLPWILFFNQTYDGDAGEIWEPTFTGLTTSGTPTFEGRYYRISDALKYFSITITPGTNTTSNAGTTFCDNFPLNVTGTGFCIAVGGALGIGTGIVQVGGDIYTPSWSSVTVPVTILGLVEAS